MESVLIILARGTVTQWDTLKRLFRLPPRLIYLLFHGHGDHPLVLPIAKQVKKSGNDMNGEAGNSTVLTQNTGDKGANFAKLFTKYWI